MSETHSAAGNAERPRKPLRPRRRAAAAAAPITKPFQHQDAILAALDVEVPQADPPAGYEFAMIGLVVFLALITAGFVALVAFLGWLLVWHVYQAVVSLAHGPYFVFHLPMALLGGLLLLFLIKPVFFRRKDEGDALIVLTPEDEPLLFAFVAKLCAATGARPPKLIEVDCEANAAARLHRRGVAGALGRDFVLRAGLPLVASMSVRQFAGVLAHELGHFNQRGGMKSSLLLRLLIAFFAKIVFERDRLDEKLERLRYSRNRLGRALFWAAAWLVEAARGVLWLMMVAGELLTCGVLRRMEYDADRVEAHVAGCRDFLLTGKLMLFLNLAARRARYDLADAWEQRRLADDLPRLIVAHARQLAEHKADILKSLDEGRTNWFDTHPCHRDRVASVNATGADGLVDCDVAAKHLFRDFGALCRRATQAFYRTAIGEELDNGKLVPTAELVEQRQGERESFRALRRFYRDGAAMTRPIFPGPDALRPPGPHGAAAVTRALTTARERMLDLVPVAAGAAEQFQTSDPVTFVARSKIALASLFYSHGANKFSAASEVELREHEPLRLKSIHQLIPFENVARDRLTAALRLAQTAPWADESDVAAAAAAAARGTPRPRSVAGLVGLCHALEKQVEHVERLRGLALDVRLMFGAYDGDRPHPPLVNRILQSGDRAVEIIDRLKFDLADRPFPFAHASEGVSVAGALIPARPDPKDPVAVHAAASCVVDRFYDLTYRALAELTAQAERVERAIGLESLPDLPPRRDAEGEEAERKENRRNTRRYWIGYGCRALGGVAMLFLLVSLSVSPPALPSFGWPSGGSSRGGGGGGYAYRPAGFRLSSPRYGADYAPRVPAAAPAQPDPFGPRRTTPRPDYPQPNYPRPPDPYVPRANPNVPTVRPYQPPPSNPSRPASPAAPSPGRR